MGMVTLGGKGGLGAPQQQQPVHHISVKLPCSPVYPEGKPKGELLLKELDIHPLLET